MQNQSRTLKFLITAFPYFISAILAAKFNFWQIKNDIHMHTLTEVMSWIILSAERILGGEIVYRDFPRYWAPGHYYLHAILHWLSNGYGMLVERYMLGFYAVAVPMLTIYIGQRLGFSWLSRLFLGLLCVLWGPMTNFWPYPEWHIMLPTLLLILMTLTSNESQSRQLAFFSGIIRGVTFVFKQHLGVVSFVLQNFALITKFKTDKKKLILLCTIGFAIPAAGMFLHFLVKGGFTPAFDRIILGVANYNQTMRLLPQAFHVYEWLQVLLLLLSFVLIRWPKIVVTLVITQIALAIFTQDSGAAGMMYITQMIIPLILLCIGLAIWSYRKFGFQNNYLMILFSTAGIFLSVYPRLEPSRSSHILPYVALLLFLAAHLISTKKWSQHLLSLAIFVCLVHGGNGQAQYYISGDARTHNQFAYSEQFGFNVKAVLEDTLQQVKTWYEPLREKAGNKLMVLSCDALFYSVTKSRPLIYNDVYFPEMLSPAEKENIVRAVKENKNVPILFFKDSWWFYKFRMNKYTEDEVLFNHIPGLKEALAERKRSTLGLVDIYL